jgi:hypothetical protein
MEHFLQGVMRSSMERANPPCLLRAPDAKLDVSEATYPIDPPVTPRVDLSNDTIKITRRY